MTAAGVLDTSVFIANETGRPLDAAPIPDEVATTVIAEAGRRVRINDLWIAAVAASRGLPAVTQDGDFDGLDGVAGLTVIRV